MQVLQSGARFNVLACGRRWGKSRLGALLSLYVGLRQGRAWWVAPSYKMAGVGWRLLRQLAQQLPGVEIRQGDQLIHLPGGGSVQVRSADDPQSLRGEGLDFLVLDECAFIQEIAWTEALRPALSDRQGSALFISTPKGRNWFWRLWMRGQADDDPEWRSWQFATQTNPYIVPAELEAAQRSLPERVWRQEYMAEFVDDAGGVFRRVVESATLTPMTMPLSGHTYVAGVDWALHNDFTVITIIDATDQTVAYMDRYNGVDYTVQRQRIAALCERFGVQAILSEDNAMGGPNNEELQSAGLPLRRFTTTHSTKANLIEALAAAFERSALRILNDPILVAELQAYEVQRTPSGLVRYGAPAGIHDDCVISVALAWAAAQSADSARLGDLFSWVD